MENTIWELVDWNQPMEDTQEGYQANVLKKMLFIYC
jgi:hypothetical protein